jgi:hypothetical protein
MHFPVLTATLLAAIALAGSAADAPADPIAQFIRKDLELELSRFPQGASKTHFPGLLPAAAGEEASGWRRLGTAMGPRSSITNYFDLRFDADRLVELRMTVVGTWSPATNDADPGLLQFHITPPPQKRFAP